MGGILVDPDQLESTAESLADDSTTSATATGGADLQADPMEGVQIGRYKILQLIGEGGFGMVYMAEQVESVHRRVALKIIKAGMDTKQVIARFEAERQALAMMDHPNIARVLDVGETEEGRPYFVMELVKGMPITTYCHEEKLSIEVRLQLFMQVCTAVQHAHMKGIIHRDLKPSNILVTLHDGDPVPKVIDFGIAKAMDQRLTDKTLFTRYDHMVGTPAYMSPEQAALSGLDVDTRSDVYALGVLLYELLTGTTPLDSETLRQAAFDEMRRIIREDEPPKPSTRLTAAKTSNSSRAKTPVHIPPSKIARDLDWIVMKALDKDRGRRYDTAAGLAHDIERFTRNEPVTAGPPGVAYKLRKFAARNRTTVTASAFVAFTLVCAVIFTAWGMVRAVSAEKKAQENATLTREAGEHAEREAARAIEAEKQATAEAEIAEAINDFLRKDLLMQASPEVNGDRDLTFRTVLDRVSGLVAERFDGQPILEAEVRFTLAEVYFEIQDRQAYATGAEHAHHANALFQSLLGKRDPKSMRAEALSLALDSLDVKIIELAQPETLLRICSQLRDVAEHQGATLGPSHPDTLTTKYYLAGRTSSQERQSLAESLPDLESIEDLDGLFSAIGILSLTRRDSESTRETLEIARQKLGEHHVATLKTNIQLGYALVREENYLAAEAVFKDVVPLWRRAFVGYTRYGTDPGEGYAEALPTSARRKKLKRFSRSGSSLPTRQRVPGAWKERGPCFVG
ncbi:MAG: tRNA A-37 threonylcarbamoyl transferase component Bud32 [Verrucomicrobiales bacterium]|jgi:tRNA A-37 threonylcarbamoyl transferase component Bud32